MKYTEQQAFDAFEKALTKAQAGVDFGPMNGFGGYNADIVWDKLPEWVQKFYTNINLPEALLVGNAKGIIDYADHCGMKTLVALAIFIKAYEEYHNVTII